MLLKQLRPPQCRGAPLIQPMNDVQDFTRERAAETAIVRVRSVSTTRAL